MRGLYAFLLFFTTLIANDGAHKFASSEECKACHKEIYNEFRGSMHANAVAHKDPIHNAVWQNHPHNLKQNRYACGKCHTPAADNLDKMLSPKQKAMPDSANATHNEAISCAYCHRIENIELHKKSNVNIISKEEKKYFGTLKEHIDSPFHAIATEGNEHMKNGNVCIGCHSHKMNKHGLNVCSTNIDNQLDGANCVSCHMPKVEGSVSALNETATHSFHGFAGAHFHSNMLTRHVDISLLKEINDFIVNIDNRTSHALLLHPLRLAVLKVSVIRGKERIELKNEYFTRVIGKDGKPAMPWIADTTIENSMIQANEKRSVKYNFKLQKGDSVEIQLGWYLVNPNVIDVLKLQNEKVATEFHLFKKEIFNY